MVLFRLRTHTAARLHVIPLPGTPPCPSTNIKQEISNGTRQHTRNVQWKYVMGEKVSKDSRTYYSGREISKQQCAIPPPNETTSLTTKTYRGSVSPKNTKLVKLAKSGTRRLLTTSLVSSK